MAALGLHCCIWAFSRTWSQHLWRTGLPEPVSPALACGFLTTGSTGKSLTFPLFNAELPAGLFLYANSSGIHTITRIKYRIPKLTSKGSSKQACPLPHILFFINTGHFFLQGMKHKIEAKRVDFPWLHLPGPSTEPCMESQQNEIEKITT